MLAILSLRSLVATLSFSHSSLSFFYVILLSWLHVTFYVSSAYIFCPFWFYPFWFHIIPLLVTRFFIHDSFFSPSLSILSFLKRYWFLLYSNKIWEIIHPLNLWNLVRYTPELIDDCEKWYSIRFGPPGYTPVLDKSRKIKILQSM